VRAIAVAGCMSLVLVSGCSEVAQQGASAAAVAFVKAEPAQACGLLAPDTADAVESDSGTDCETGLSQLDLPKSAEVRRVEVAVESAQVQFDDQVVFLARFPDGWRVTAAGCVRDDPDPAVPYKCEVKP
jgi:hypothetical protein